MSGGAARSAWWCYRGVKGWMRFSDEEAKEMEDVLEIEQETINMSNVGVWQPGNIQFNHSEFKLFGCYPIVHDVRVERIEKEDGDEEIKMTRYAVFPDGEKGQVLITEIGEEPDFEGEWWPPREAGDEPKEKKLKVRANRPPGEPREPFGNTHESTDSEPTLVASGGAGAAAATKDVFIDLTAEDDA